MMEEETKQKEKTFANGTKHTESRCPVCDCFLKWLAHPGNPLETMHFGKYKGRTIMSIAHEDYDYAWWAAENLESAKMRESFRLALESLK